VYLQITVYLNVCAIKEAWLEEKLKKFLEAWGIQWKEKGTEGGND